MEVLNLQTVLEVAQHTRVHTHTHTHTHAHTHTHTHHKHRLIEGGLYNIANSG